MRRRDRRPAVGDRLELAVAVELVAEQVGQQQRARAQLADDLAEPELVDLEEPGVAVARAASSSVAATPPAMFAPARLCTSRAPRALEDRGGHRGGRRLAVRGRDDRAAALQARREAADRVRLEAHEQLARAALVPPRPARRDSAPAARAAATLASSDAHASGSRTRSAPGTARMVIGSSPIGSPSA